MQKLVQLIIRTFKSIQIRIPHNIFYKNRINHDTVHILLVTRPDPQLISTAIRCNLQCQLLTVGDLNIAIGIGACLKLE